MAELVDALISGVSGRGSCRFDSCYPHLTKVLNLNEVQHFLLYS